MNNQDDVLFAFPVDITLPRGDSTHVREFSEHIAREVPSCTIFTYNDVVAPSKLRRVLGFRRGLLSRYFSRGRRKVYLRYFPGIFLDMMLLKVLGRDVFVELNAVISDEAEDLRRSAILRFVHRLDERVICRFAKALITVTPEICRYYREEYGKAETVVVNNGVNTEHFDPDRAEYPHDLEHLEQSFVVGFMGGLSPWQDLATLVSAFDELVNMRRIRDIHCVIVGSGSEEGAIREQIASLGLERQVIMTGARKYQEIPRYVKLFSIGVAPLKGSRMKNTGSAAIKVFEYLAMAKPVVLPEVGSFSDMLSERGVGVVYRGMDHMDLADTIVALYSDRGAVAAMGKRARELVKNEYSWAASTRETLRIINGG